MVLVPKNIIESLVQQFAQHLLQSRLPCLKYAVSAREKEFSEGPFARVSAFHGDPKI